MITDVANIFGTLAAIFEDRRQYVEAEQLYLRAAAMEKVPSKSPASTTIWAGWSIHAGE